MTRVLRCAICCLLLASPAAFAAPPGCSGPEYQALDFWLGAWNVTTGKGFAGDNQIAKVLAGCAVRESWTDAGGGRGESLFFFDRRRRRWKQVWVTEDGGWKEKIQVDAPEGAIRFQGELPRPGGATVLDRTTLRRLPDGKVVQRIEQSADRGATWQAWEGTYAPKQAVCGSPEHAQLDFWLGDWDAVVRSRKSPRSEEWVEARGSNHITKDDNGCTLMEDFHAAGPGGPWTGRSVSQWVPAEKRWRQTWVDESNSFLAFTGGAEGKDFVLTGENRKRMVFTDIKPDSFRWRWEATRDGGTTWRPLLLIDYTRHSRRSP